MGQSEEPHGDATLVITAPQALSGRLAIHSGARLTTGVLVELAVEARSRLILSSPYLHVASLLREGVLAHAIKHALERGVDVEIASAGGYVLEMRQLLAKATGPSASRIRLYQPQANVADEKQLGSHAKFCICDERKAYLGSANFTTPGLGTHLEMGVLVQGPLAKQIGKFWDDLKTIGVFVPA